MATIHISEAEATSDLPNLLAKVRAGAEVVIDKDASSSIVLRVATDPSVRRLSESLRMAMQYRSNATLDAEFALDLDSAVTSHLEPLQSPWE